MESPVNSDRRSLTLIALFEIPALVLILHGIAYLCRIPGLEVTVNSLGGKQPVAFDFFRIAATGGLLIPLVLGYLIPFWHVTERKFDRHRFGLIVGMSYLIASVAWWMLVGMGVMDRFV